ncbi:MAG: ribosome maturation factor RimM [Ilumatobacter sp.]|nr:ribosome maturation factor RimM [Ilumatobacter sp.]
MTRGPIPPGHLEVGHIRRAHGLRGDVFVQLVTDRSERLDVGSVLVSERGELVVEASRLLPNGRWVVKFDGIADRTEAERWNNVALHGAPLADSDALWVHELIGARVEEVDGTQRGTCVSVVANPAADLLELDTGALVPSNFIVGNTVEDRSGPDASGTGGSGHVIVVDVPDGLFELAEGDG